MIWIKLHYPGSNEIDIDKSNDLKIKLNLKNVKFLFCKSTHKDIKQNNSPHFDI